jgi:hypothetical protein
VGPRDLPETTQSLLPGCSNAWRSARRPMRSSCSRPFLWSRIA